MATNLMKMADNANTGTLAVIAPLDDRVVVYETRKGLKDITAHGATMKGGKAFLALRDAAAEDALRKALHGRYRPAAEMIIAPFGTRFESGASFFGDPWKDKPTFQLLCERALREPATKKNGDTDAKKALAHEIANAYLTACPRAAAAPETIDNE